MKKILKIIKYISFLCVLSLLFVTQHGLADTGQDVTPCAPSSGQVQPCPFELPVETHEKLKINAGFGWGIFSGSIYNDNSDYTVTQLVISMEPIHDHHHMDMMGGMHEPSHEARIKQIKMHLRPMTKSALSMALDEDVADAHDFEWKILKVYGYEAY